MPLYSYRCTTCEYETEAVNRIAERRTHAPICGKNATHGPTDIKLNANLGHVQGDCHYICPMTRRPVTSHRQRNYIMREKNVVDARDFDFVKGIEKIEQQHRRDQEVAAGITKDLVTGQERPFQASELISSMGTP